jgi:hypothetical protein
MCLEILFMLLAFAAQWGASCITIDNGGAYLECNLKPEDHVYMFLGKEVVCL